MGAPAAGVTLAQVASVGPDRVLLRWLGLTYLKPFERQQIRLERSVYTCINCSWLVICCA